MFLRLNRISCLGTFANDSTRIIRGTAMSQRTVRTQSCSLRSNSRLRTLISAQSLKSYET